MAKPVRRISRFMLILVCLLAVSPVMAFAAPTQLDMRVVFRALKFLEPAPSGTVDFAVVYNPNEPGSEAEAKTVVNLAGEGAGNVNFRLRPYLVPMDRADTVNARMAYLSKGTESANPGLLSRKIMTIAINSDCAQREACVLSVSSSPKVEVLVNMRAADQVGVSFSTIFRMMITEY